MTAGERDHIAILQEEMRALVMSGNTERYSEINDAFHGAIYAGAHNAHLADMTIATRARVQPFRRAQFRNMGRLQKSHAEHDVVVLAIAQGNREGAAAAMRAHIMTVGAEYGIYMETV
jgi:DNA-binding GntR family transcriptional regulator